ncbi:MAG TPA: PH domain-containing protein [Actinomycetota bacterium]|nr:PH domain-containing protein [Actinomycetota bacterium]
MTFPRRLLADGEDLVLDLRPHWIALVWPLAEIALDAAGVGLILAYMPHAWPTWGRWLVVAVGAALIVVSAVPKMVAWATSHFVVTTDRVIHRSGWFAKRSMEIPLENISDVRFSQGVFERVIGAGDLVLESAGEFGQETFTNIRRPEVVQKTIYETNEANLRRIQAPSVAPSIADELAKLDRLRDEGVISGDEFAAQKARLLDRG